MTTDTDSDEPLFCSHDNVEVQSDAPACPHPSSQCTFRDTCPIIAAIRRKKRNEADR